MNWMRFKWFYFFLSALVLVPGIISLFSFGLRPSIDFSGGTLLEIKFSDQFVSDRTAEGRSPLVANEEFEKAFRDRGYVFASVQSIGAGGYLLRLPSMDKNQVTSLELALAESLGERPQELRFETVGPTLGKELLRKTLIAITLASGAILGYVAWQFKDKKFGTAAILAMFHDTLIIMGIFSLLGHFKGVEVDTLFVTAVLTILSFSVHDTVVVFDRIREGQKRFPQASFESLVNKAVSETLVRSLNNSLTIIFMLVALLLLGGETIRWFVVALLIGTVAGTYSSTFTAAPLLVVWDNFKKKSPTR